MKEEIREILSKHQVISSDVLVLELENFMYQFALSMISGREIEQRSPSTMSNISSNLPFPTRKFDGDTVATTFAAAAEAEVTTTEEQEEVKDVTEFEATQDALKRQWESEHEDES